MTILTCIADIATVIGIEVPTAVFTSTDRELVELQATANRVAKAMARHYDWQVLKTIATVTGDGTTEDFSLPTDYGRQLIKTKLYTTTRPFSPLEHITDTDTWLSIVLSGTTVSSGQWTIYGNLIHIRPALASGELGKYYYITNNIVDPAAGSNKEAFTLDSDTFLLNEYTLGLGIIYRWKQQKGLPYAEEMTDFEIALSEDVSRDKGSKILTVGTRRMQGGIDSEFAYPGELG
jgi:hypothetical protein